MLFITYDDNCIKLPRKENYITKEDFVVPEGNEKGEVFYDGVNIAYVDIETYEPFKGGHIIKKRSKILQIVYL